MSIPGLRGAVLGGYSVTLTSVRRLTLHLESANNGVNDLNIGCDGLVAHFIDSGASRASLEDITEVPLDQILDSEWLEIQRCIDGGEWPPPVPFTTQQAQCFAGRLKVRAFSICGATRPIGWVICQSVAKLGRKNS